VADIKKPNALSTNYGRKPYIPGDYDDHKELMNRPSRYAMEMQRESPRSQEDKPYTEDTGDYQAMEHWAPLPFPLRPAAINLQIRPASPGPVPGPGDWDVPTLESCFITCKSPGRDCTDPVKCRPGVSAGSWIDYLSTVVTIEVFINGAPHTDWVLIPSLPDPLRINAPTEGWTLNPPGPGDLVDVILRNKVTGLIECNSILVNISCEEEACSCDVGEGYVAVAIDTGSTSETIAAEGSITIYATNGCPPYTWGVSGTGYSLDHAETVAPVNTLRAVAAGT